MGVVGKCISKNGSLRRGKLEKMAKRKRKTDMEVATELVLGFANLVDALFVKYTGKTVVQLLREPPPRPRELPQAEEVKAESSRETPPIDTEPDMPLADAYAILGLKPNAPLEDVKKHYRNLAKAFHTDKGAMNDEAMKLINRAYERITKHGSG